MVLFQRREDGIRELLRTASAEETLMCPSCKAEHDRQTLVKNYYVCPTCGMCQRVTPRDRITMLSDVGAFHEMAKHITSKDFLEFPGYSEKLEKAKKDTGEEEAVVCGVTSIEGMPCCIFVMDPRFIMASMGSAVGEKITRTFEHAYRHSLPVIGLTASGGARMQEGIVSLMQMAKVSGAVKKHGDGGNLYITVLTDPTTGGVTASFAMQGDIILAEPRALVGFAGRRVVEQTTRARLPDNFQSAEFLLEHGFVDKIVERKDLRKTLATLLRQHNRRRGAANDTV